LLVAVAAVNARAQAPTPTPVEQLAKDAALAYRNGDYGHALALLQQAYQSEPLTPILYNLAKTYDKLGERGQAIAYYARYVAAQDADARLKSKAQERIDALAHGAAVAAPPEEASAEAAPAAKEAPVAPPSTAEPRLERPAPPPAEAATAPEPQLALRTVPASDRLQRRRHLYRDCALGLSALGLASLAVAVGLGVNARSLHDQFSTTVAEEAKRALRDRSQSQAAAADALFAVGGVAVAGSAVFYALWLRKPTREPRAALTPWLTHDRVGLSARVHF
jgi:hypothetical protein